MLVEGELGVTNFLILWLLGCTPRCRSSTPSSQKMADSSSLNNHLVFLSVIIHFKYVNHRHIRKLPFEHTQASYSSMIAA